MSFKSHWHWYGKVYIFVMIMIICTSAFWFAISKDIGLLDQAKQFCEDRGYNYEFIDDSTYCVETFDDTAKIYPLIRSDGQFYLEVKDGK